MMLCITHKHVLRRKIDHGIVTSKNGDLSDYNFSDSALGYAVLSEFGVPLGNASSECAPAADVYDQHVMSEEPRCPE